MTDSTSSTEAAVTSASTTYPPHALRDYAILADGRRGAVIGPRGDIAWMCAPRWDSAAVFSTLVGGAGAYGVTPADTFVWGGYYEPRSLIWRSRWVTTTSTIECREALAYPGDAHRLILLRRIEAGSDEAVVDVVLDVGSDFGRRQARPLRRDGDGRWITSDGALRIRWSGASDARMGASGALTLRLRLPPGAHHDLVLEISDKALPDPVDADRCWHRTEDAWRADVPSLDSTVAPRDAKHSYAILRGLTAPGGGMVAATTLGLPERARAGRNYDYRYVWLRDQAYAGIAAGVDEPYPLLDDAVSFLTARLLEHGSTVAPAYRVDGSDVPAESTLGLSGYPGGRDVVGNWVNGQFQLDAIGETLQVLAVAAGHDRLDADNHRALRIAVDTVKQRWNQPEAGIWELDDDWWSHSRLACVAGLRSVAAYAPQSATAELESLANEILAETSRRCLSPHGHWQRSPSRTGTDAALLLPPVRGALAASDARTIGTLRAVEQDLTSDGYLYRFAHDDVPLGEAEGAFLLCGFGMSLAQWHQGDEVAAFRWFERNRAACGTAGILTEEFDVRQRQLRGNLPQAFVHAMLLECSQRLTSPYQEGIRR